LRRRGNMKNEGKQYYIEERRLDRGYIFATGVSFISSILVFLIAYVFFTINSIAVMPFSVFGTLFFILGCYFLTNAEYAITKKYVKEERVK
jgi:VIT1/CCC1 family predicted Fe2+/Mn2+ transporter